MGRLNPEALITSAMQWRLCPTL